MLGMEEEVDKERKWQIYSIYSRARIFFLNASPAYTLFLHPAPFYFFFFSFFCAHQIVVLSSPFPVTSPKRKASLSSIQAVAAILPSYTDIIIIIIYIHGLSFSIYQYLIRRAG